MLPIGIVRRHGTDGVGADGEAGGPMMGVVAGPNCPGTKVGGAGNTTDIRGLTASVYPVR